MSSARTRPCDEAAIRSTPVAPECLAASRPWVLVVTILASTMAYIDESVVNVALPAIERDLGVPVAVIQWLVNAYTLSLSAFLLIGGAAGDPLRPRPVFLIGPPHFRGGGAWGGPGGGRRPAARRPGRAGRRRCALDPVLARDHRRRVRRGRARPRDRPLGRLLRHIRRGGPAHRRLHRRPCDLAL